MISPSMGRKFCRRGAVLVCECFVFRQKNKRTYFEFGRFSYEAYVLVSGLFFYFGRWLLAFSSSICHAELISASHREPLLVLLRGQILKRVQDDGGWCRLLTISFFLSRLARFGFRLRPGNGRLPILPIEGEMPEREEGVLNSATKIHLYFVITK